MNLSEAQLKQLSASTKLDKGTRDGFDSIRAEIHHGRDWNNTAKLRKIRKELTNLQRLIDEGMDEIKAGKEPSWNRTHGAY